MIIIVDGYNLLRTIPPYKKTITDQERTNFIVQLNAYARAKGHKIILVFDGDSYDRPMKDKVGAVWVVYSGYDESADEYIKRYVQKHYAKDVLLVSSDGELNTYAASYKVPSIDSTVFYDLLLEMRRQKSSAQLLPRAYQAVKTTPDATYDIDDIMIYASKTVPEKVEDQVCKEKKHSSKKQLNKKERTLLKKLRKL